MESAMFRALLHIAIAGVQPAIWLMMKRDWRGREHIPLTGPAIFVVNHISVADPILVGHYLYANGRHPRFLAKDSLFRVPILGRALHGIGQIPVRRGSADAMLALKSAVEAIEAGETVIVYPEGTCTKDPELWPMVGKTGAARLAMQTGAPVIPIAQWGAQRFHDPITGKIGLRPRTKISVAAGPAVDLSEFSGKPQSAEVLRSMTSVIMLQLRENLAVIRGLPIPEGPLYSPGAKVA
ncbi:MAG: lysophospholipid acyltransferase family protein [Mycobacteriales bacterium]